MPKENIDYSNTIIYKIYCNDSSITDLYVGHTTNFIKRKYQHKILCNSSKKLKIYDLIRINGGWDNWNMIEIAKYKCQDATEARIREQEHYDLLKPTLNSINPISNNEYCILSIDNGIQNIDDNHKENLNKKYVCEICDYRTNKKCNYNTHNTSKRHINTISYYLKQQNLANSSKQNNHVKNIDFTCLCGKKYISRQSLWRHKKTCLILTNNIDTDKNLIHNNVNLIQHLLKENKEIKELLLEIVKNNTTYKLTTSL